MRLQEGSQWRSCLLLIMNANEINQSLLNRDASCKGALLFLVSCNEVMFMSICILEQRQWNLHKNLCCVFYKFSYFVVECAFACFSSMFSFMMWQMRRIGCCWRWSYSLSMNVWWWNVRLWNKKVAWMFMINTFQGRFLCVWWL